MPCCDAIACRACKQSWQDLLTQSLLHLVTVYAAVPCIHSVASAPLLWLPAAVLRMVHRAHMVHTWSKPPPNVGLTHLYVAGPAAFKAEVGDGTVAIQVVGCCIVSFCSFDLITEAPCKTRQALMQSVGMLEYAETGTIRRRNALEVVNRQVRSLA